MYLRLLVILLAVMLHPATGFSQEAGGGGGGGG